MSGRDLVLAQGIAAARAGDRQAARRLLAEAAQRDPGSELAWLWLSGVLDTAQGRSYCLQKVLDINPANQVAREGLQALAEANAARALVVNAPAVRPGGTGAVSRPGPASPPAAPERRPWAAQAGAALGRAGAGLVAAAGGWRQRAGQRRAEVPRVATRQRGAARARRRVPEAGKVPFRPRLDFLARPHFWQVLIGCLAVVAVGLIAVLLYSSTRGLAAAPADARLAAGAVALASPSPHGTLRPTFTATATSTPTATPSPTPSPTHTATPTPTDTPMPTCTATCTPSPTLQPLRRKATAVPAVAPAAAPAPRPTLPPRSWDARLDTLAVRVEPVGVAEGQKYWRLVEARWADERQSAGKHSIFVEVLDLQGRRAVGQPVIVQWADGNVALPVQDRPAPDWGVDFGMYNCLGSYAVSVGGAPSDRIVGLGLGTAETPYFTVHTSFYLVFRLAQR